jgi:hypothetical protein
MYLRETKRRNRDGSTVSYLQLAHSERHPVTGVPQAKVIHNFGRADTVDRDALARLVASISRFLDPQQAIAAAHAGEIEILDSRRVGGAWVLDRLWERLGVGELTAPGLDRLIRDEHSLYPRLCPQADRLTEHPGPRGVTGRISSDDCRVPDRAAPCRCRRIAGSQAH